MTFQLTTQRNSGPAIRPAGHPTASSGGPGSGLRLASTDARYAHVHLIPPSPAGFVHLAVQTAAPRRPGPVRGRDERRERAVAALTAYAKSALHVDGVRQAAVFRAALLTPTPSEHPSRPVQPDVALLAEAAEPADALALTAGAAFAALLGGLRAAEARAHVLVARNARRIADVAYGGDGLFLFNHFLADDEDVAVAVWERLAAWYERKMALNNSVLLAPARGQPSAFALVNHARFDLSLPGLMARQFARPSFFQYVQANLHANGIVAMPVLYRLAWTGQSGAGTAG